MLLHHTLQTMYLGLYIGADYVSYHFLRFLGNQSMRLGSTQELLLSTLALLHFSLESYLSSVLQAPQVF